MMKEPSLHTTREGIAALTAAMILIAALGLAAGTTEAAEHDATSLAKAAQNPIADMISLPFQLNINPNTGPEKKTQEVLNIQPVNLRVAAYYNVERPDNAPNWNIRLQLQFLFPK